MIGGITRWEKYYFLYGFDRKSMDRKKICDEYIVFENKSITSDYIDKIKEYSNKILSVSNGIIVHNLILNEENKINWLRYLLKVLHSES